MMGIGTTELEKGFRASAPTIRALDFELVCSRTGVRGERRTRRFAPAASRLRLRRVLVSNWEFRISDFRRA